MSSESLEINVITQNVLLDYRRTKEGLILPQDDRINAIAETIAAFDGDLDVVGIQEAHKSQSQHNGEILAKQLGHEPGFWFEHNTKQPGSTDRKGRPNEYMGVFGDMVQEAMVIETGDRRKAVMTIIAGTAFVNLHLRSGWGAKQLRLEQSEAINEALADFPNAVVFGDFNEPDIPFLPQVSPARQNLKNNGFESVFKLKPDPERPPLTSPTKTYRKAMIDGRKRHEKPFVWHGQAIDDILVRGKIAVLAAGVLEPVLVDASSLDIDTRGVPLDPSDHSGLYATLELSAA